MSHQPLLARHGVEILQTSHQSYRLDFLSTPAAPVLENLVATHRDDQGKPFSARDLELNRVAVRKVELLHHGIECYPVSWAQYLILSNEVLRDRVPSEECFRLLSVACLLKTADSRLILSFRSKNVSHYKETWHVSAAGHIDLEGAVKSASPFLQVMRELQEELNVTALQLTGLRQLGLCRECTSEVRPIEVCFLAQSDLTSQELMEGAKNAKDFWEGKVHSFSTREIVDKLQEERFVPSAAATIILALDSGFLPVS